ncbi:FACT complex subunit [Hortaea werneckii]|nr:FACT complex subunit [Hortaea werneckii]
MVLVDPKNNSVILPIMGRPVPFHINTIKNATTSQEGGWCYLRINFLSPGQVRPLTYFPKPGYWSHGGHQGSDDGHEESCSAQGAGEEGYGGCDPPKWSPHLFFQPCVGELIVIIHVHLHNPIMIGKKKTKDVQFYREATEMQFDETGNRKRKHRYGDEEEFEAEQEEKRRRAQLDKEFRNFAEKIADAGKGEGLAVDMPFRDLGFNGVPSRSSVTIQPTTDCLVQLTEPPFMVVTLTDIEVVHLERVQFGLKNFDMVIVFKDFTRPPAHINTIPVEALDGVKDWLDSVDIPFTEGPLNLNWATIMKTVIADPHAFFKDGGWSFLSTESDSEDGSEEEEESEFGVSEEDMGSDESSEEESDFDDDASAEASDEDVSEDDEGEDWDEMEKKAAKRDLKKCLWRAFRGFGACMAGGSSCWRYRCEENSVSPDRRVRLVPGEKLRRARSVDCVYGFKRNKSRCFFTVNRLLAQGQWPKSEGGRGRVMKTHRVRHKFIASYIIPPPGKNLPLPPHPPGVPIPFTALLQRVRQGLRVPRRSSRLRDDPFVDRDEEVDGRNFVFDAWVARVG